MVIKMLENMRQWIITVCLQLLDVQPKISDRVIPAILRNRLPILQMVGYGRKVGPFGYLRTISGVKDFQFTFGRQSNF